MRKFIAIAGLVAWLSLYVWAATLLGARLAEANGWVQALFFLVAGTAWVIPMRSLFMWMNSDPSRLPDRDQLP